MRFRFQSDGLGARRWILVGVITFGSLFLTVGLILAGVSVSLLTSAERAPGTVVSLDWRAGHSTGTSRKSRTNSGPVAYPVVEFTPAHGTPRTFRGIGLATVVIATVVARRTRRRPASSGPSASQRGSRPDVPASSRVG
ncbi:DUF3592 domain-containing protein [Streptomyces sp. NBC_01622]|uniref:DUF3592 domain-containing protein n=1 Tax=Streptomyces sp. NBC_01622 TaxID=2975903 RepID=UPI003869DDC8|nr:DUF3592 domain-containing protein [Streptomyces sp. NBC_01622]